MLAGLFQQALLGRTGGTSSGGVDLGGGGGTTNVVSAAAGMRDDNGVVRFTPDAFMLETT